MDFIWYNLSFSNVLIFFLAMVPVFTLLYAVSAYGVIGSIPVVLHKVLSGYLGNLKNRAMKGTSLLFTVIFTLVVIFNLWGLFPGLFGVSCQMVVMVFLSFNLWLALNLSSLSLNATSYTAHLTPEGSPLALVPLLNLMELVSNFMRPLTLTLRLCINMTTGHILLSLLNISVSVSLLVSPFMGLMTIALVVGYFSFECVICLIQGCVYTLLVSQYLDEHTTEVVEQYNCFSSSSWVTPPW